MGWGNLRPSVICHPERSGTICWQIVLRSRRISCSIGLSAAYRGVLSIKLHRENAFRQRLRMWAVQGSFDCVSASRSEADTPLRMTG